MAEALPLAVKISKLSSLLYQAVVMGEASLIKQHIDEACSSLSDDAAAAAGDDDRDGDSTQQLLSESVNSIVDGFPLTLIACRLGFEDVAEELLRTGVVDLPRCLSSDELFRLGPTAIYISGGQTLLHVAVENHATSVLKMLLAGVVVEEKDSKRTSSNNSPKSSIVSCDDVLRMFVIKDFDGQTPIGLATMNHALAPLVPMLQKALSECISQCSSSAIALTNSERSLLDEQLSVDHDTTLLGEDVRRAYVQAMRARITASIKLRETSTSAAAASASSPPQQQQQCPTKAFTSTYQPLQPFNRDFDIHATVATPSMACDDHHRNEEEARGEEGLTGADSPLLLFNANWRESITSIGGGVYTVRLFTEEGCQRLREALQHAETAAADAGPDVQLRRPNSMNRYGLVLRQVGFGTWLDSLCNKNNEPGSTTTPSPLVEMARYHDEHEPDREKKILLCGEAEEADCDESKSSHPFRSVHSFSIRYRLDEDLSLSTHLDDSDFTFNVCLGESFTGATLYFHTQEKDGQEKPDGQDQDAGATTLQYNHQVGTAVFHRGKIPHGAEPLTSGSRTNLVIWCKTQEAAYFE